MSLLKEISITELTNLRIGHASDHDGQTGVTVLYFPQGAKVGCDISDNPINAIVLSGGSAYGLAAADGVMNYLESQNVGYNTGAALVPLVCQSCIYDLSYGNPKVRPTAKTGEEACLQAFFGTDARTGNIGAASIGDVPVDINMAGTLAAEVMAQAIQNAIHTSQIPDEEFLKYV